MSAMPELNWATDTVQRLRSGYAQERAAIADQSAPNVQIDTHDFCTGQGLVFTPHDLRSDQDILYFHGGGWIVGSPDTHRTLCSWMAQISGRRVYSAPYRLAPEHIFPAQAQDAAKAVDEFLRGRDAGFIAGDSAGAAMALWGESGCTAVDKVLGVICLYGAFGCTEYLDGASDKYKDDGLNATAVLRMYADLGCEDTAEFQAHFNRSGAPVLLCRAGNDPLGQDNEWFANWSDRRISHHFAAGAEHAYLQFCGSDANALRAMHDICAWMDGGGRPANTTV